MMRLSVAGILCCAALTSRKGGCAVHTKCVTVRAAFSVINLLGLLGDVELLLGDTGGEPGAAEPAVVVGVGVPARMARPASKGRFF
jgi:hypothetical protein